MKQLIWKYNFSCNKGDPSDCYSLQKCSFFEPRFLKPWSLQPLCITFALLKVSKWFSEKKGTPKGVLGSTSREKSIAPHFKYLVSSSFLLLLQLLPINISNTVLAEFQPDGPTYMILPCSFFFTSFPDFITWSPTTSQEYQLLENRFPNVDLNFPLKMYLINTIY